MGVTGGGGAPTTPTSMPTPAATPDCVVTSPSSSAVAILTEADRYVAEMIAHAGGLHAAGPASPCPAGLPPGVGGIHIKQEPMGEPCGGPVENHHMTASEAAGNDVPRDVHASHRSVDDDEMDEEDMEEEEEDEEEEEAEDLSLSSSIASEPQTATCP